MSQSPKSGQLHSNGVTEKTLRKWSRASQSPKSGQLHSNTRNKPPNAKETQSQSPKSGQLHSNDGNQFFVKSGNNTYTVEVEYPESQSPKSGQLHSNAANDDWQNSVVIFVSIP